MRFSVVKHGVNPLRDTIAEAITQKFIEHGHEVASPESNIQFVLNLIDVDDPKFFRRRSQSIFVFSIITVENQVENLRSVCFTTLVRSLSNMVLCVVPSKGDSPDSPEKDIEIYFTTPETGFFHHPFDPEYVYQQIMPIAGSHFAMRNVLTTDLPSRYWKTSPVVENLKKFGKELDNLGVLPSPFPLREVLSEEDIKQIYDLFEMKGLSWGNLSAREPIPEFGDATFWMSARGVNKAKLSNVGKDILLVKGFDFERGQALVSVPPDHDPKARVSVDTVEHALLYRTYPDIGAIVHVHAWLEDVLCTRQIYPCGTRELAEAVVDLFHQTDNPSQTAVGLRNHGLTITGPSLDDIFDRISGKLLLEVPMIS
ncbi:MAG: class II aldolase/adducin family protein [Candidatus Aminicenantes bacterium]|nr:MAG: class II aldolase/adducin family protein [Candidatus Aminicenantes bacterium]